MCKLHEPIPNPPDRIKLIQSAEDKVMGIMSDSETMSSRVKRIDDMYPESARYCSSSFSLDWPRTRQIFHNRFT